jgi:ParB family chromosome partitioning protein
MKNELIRPMSVRQYQTIPLDKIKVLNSRNRDREDFEHNIRSIKEVGLRKPIVVNGRYFKKSGHYYLVCGEGRYLAFKELGKNDILAEIISCNKKQALLYSLVENIARVPPRCIWFAREVKRMYDSNYPLAEISNITGFSETYLRDYINLVKRGEERLIKGVEAGLFPISFALLVAKSDNTSIQNLLMDAFDNGIVNSTNFPTVRKLIALRDNRNQNTKKRNGKFVPKVQYSVEQLKTDIKRVTKEKEAFVNEASTKENRLFVLLEDLKILRGNQNFVDITISEGIGTMPTLKGNYHVQ